MVFKYFKKCKIYFIFFTFSIYTFDIKTNQEKQTNNAAHEKVLNSIHAPSPSLSPLPVPRLLLSKKKMPPTHSSFFKKITDYIQRKIELLKQFSYNHPYLFGFSLGLLMGGIKESFNYHLTHGLTHGKITNFHRFNSDVREESFMIPASPLLTSNPDKSADDIYSATSDPIDIFSPLPTVFPIPALNCPNIFSWSSWVTREKDIKTDVLDDQILTGNKKEGNARMIIENILGQENSIDTEKMDPSVCRDFFTYPAFAPSKNKPFEHCLWADWSAGRLVGADSHDKISQDTAASILTNPNPSGGVFYDISLPQGFPEIIPSPLKTIHKNELLKSQEYQYRDFLMGDENLIGGENVEKEKGAEINTTTEGQNQKPDISAPWDDIFPLEYPYCTDKKKIESGGGVMDIEVITMLYTLSTPQYHKPFKAPDQCVLDKDFSPLQIKEADCVLRQGECENENQNASFAFLNTPLTAMEREKSKIPEKRVGISTKNAHRIDTKTISLCDYFQKEGGEQKEKAQEILDKLFLSSQSKGMEGQKSEKSSDFFENDDKDGDHSAFDFSFEMPPLYRPAIEMVKIGIIALIMGKMYQIASSAPGGITKNGFTTGQGGTNVPSPAEDPPLGQQEKDSAEGASEDQAQVLEDNTLEKNSNIDDKDTKGNSDIGGITPVKSPPSNDGDSMQSDGESDGPAIIPPDSLEKEGDKVEEINIADEEQKSEGTVREKAPEDGDIADEEGVKKVGFNQDIEINAQEAEGDIRKIINTGTLDAFNEDVEKETENSHTDELIDNFIDTSIQHQSSAYKTNSDHKRTTKHLKVPTPPKLQNREKMTQALLKKKIQEHTEENGKIRDEELKKAIKISLNIAKDGTVNESFLSQRSDGGGDSEHLWAMLHNALKEDIQKHPDIFYNEDAKDRLKAISTPIFDLVFSKIQYKGKEKIKTKKYAETQSASKPKRKLTDFTNDSTHCTSQTTLRTIDSHHTHNRSEEKSNQYIKLLTEEVLNTIQEECPMVDSPNPKKRIQELKRNLFESENCEKQVISESGELMEEIGVG